jgi:hypothetical protein
VPLAHIEARVVSIWEESDMRSFLVSCLAAVVLAVGAAAVLNSVQKPAERAFASPTGVRI